MKMLVKDSYSQVVAAIEGLNKAPKGLNATNFAVELSRKISNLSDAARECGVHLVFVQQRLAEYREEVRALRLQVRRLEAQLEDELTSAAVGEPRFGPSPGDTIVEGNWPLENNWWYQVGEHEERQRRAHSDDPYGGSQRGDASNHWRVRAYPEAVTLRPIRDRFWKKW